MTLNIRCAPPPPLLTGGEIILYLNRYSNYSCDQHYSGVGEGSTVISSGKKTIDNRDSAKKKQNPQILPEIITSLSIFSPTSSLLLCHFPWGIPPSCLWKLLLSKLTSLFNFLGRQEGMISSVLLTVPIDLSLGFVLTD